MVRLISSKDILLQRVILKFIVWIMVTLLSNKEKSLCAVASCYWSYQVLDLIFINEISKTYFLHGELKQEILMDQPPEFASQKESRLVCKLCHSLYGFKQYHMLGLKFKNLGWFAVELTLSSTHSSWSLYVFDTR